MAFRLALVLAACSIALVPLPAPLVEAWYARGAYAALQPGLTGLSNQVPFALFDVLLGALLAWLAALAVRAVRKPRKGSRLPALGRAVLGLAALASVAYLAFLAVWGLNYRRVPLADRLDFSRARVTSAAARSLAADVAARVRAIQGQLPRGAWPGWERTAERLAGPFDRVQRQLGAGWSATPGVPKRSLLTFYFERAGVDGMMAPFFLEVIVNRSVLPFERPAVLAHEWAHLAGYADEAEASFVGWLVCLQASPAAEYSAELSVLWQLLPALDAREREGVLQSLPPETRDDLRAIARRVASASPVVRAAAWRVYDRYLKANRVERGVQSYGEALALLLGTRTTPGWVPVLGPRS